MNLEKRDLKMFNIVIILVLAAILLTAFGGYMMQRGAMSSKNIGMGSGRGVAPMMQAESAQTGPTGRLVTSTGIVLLIIGFVALLMTLLIRNNVFQRKTSKVP
jgi:hypothetical protein